MRSRFDAVLFDFFDTLCHLDEAVYREGKRRSAALLGVDPDRYFEAWLSLQDRCQRGNILTAAERIREVGSLLEREIPPEALAALDRAEQEVLLRCATLHPDVLPAIRRLRQIEGLLLGLVSNASATVRPLLAPLGVETLFDARIFSFEIGALKPEPAIYQEACRRLAVEPGRCLFVGDGNDRELEGALELGMLAVRIERPGAMDPYRRNPSRRWTHSLRDLRGITELPWERRLPGDPSKS